MIETSNQSGGINMSGGSLSVGRDIVGGNSKSTTMTQQVSIHQVREELGPVAAAIANAEPEKRVEAEATLNELAVAAHEGKSSDGKMAKLIDGITDLVPGAVAAVVSAFASPILGAVAGPLTKAAVDRIRPA